MRVEITDDDIAYAESLLLPEGRAFNDERRAFIRCMESRDVVACPGSGKTTALLAKLLILARKQPFDHGRGICVITHTNVAIQEVRRRASSAAASLFQYPNFFGTIDSFVDRFFALPAYVDRFGQRQLLIDDSEYSKQVARRLGSDLLKNGVIYNQLKGRLEGKNWTEQREIRRQFIEDLVLRFDGDYVTYLRGKDGATVVKGSAKPSASYESIHELKYGLLQDGYLRFRDIFPLAGLRIDDGTPELIEGRFSFAFVDEMQDCNGEQCLFLDSVFAPECSTVVQRIGDPNQAIYGEGANGTGSWLPRAPMFFSDSCRWGDSVAQLLSYARFDTSICLQGSEAAACLPPQLITFEPGEEQRVLNAFSRLLYRLQDVVPLEGTYKAVGWIAKDNRSKGRLCIPAYFPAYERSQRSQQRRFRNLISCAATAIQGSRTSTCGAFYEIIMSGVAQALYHARIKDPTSDRGYTAHSAAETWKRDHELHHYEFREQLTVSFLLAQSSGLLPSDLSCLVRSAVLQVWPLLSQAQWYLDDEAVDPILADHWGSVDIRNRYVAPNGICIDVGTVHSIKGETHTATLYLETDYENSVDGKRLADFLIGKRPSAKLAGPVYQQNLRVAHVAFSRPTHLVAFACYASSISKHEAALRKNGWVLHTVSSLLSQGGGSS